MTEAAPSEFLPDGRHWADALGCDRRASIREIERAHFRRVKELHLEQVAARLALDMAMGIARGVKR